MRSFEVKRYGKQHVVLNDLLRTWEAHYRLPDVKTVVTGLSWECQSCKGIVEVIGEKNKCVGS